MTSSDSVKIKIGILTDPNPNFLFSSLGVLKSGNGFVPLDPDYPEERLLFIIDDCKLEVLLAEAKHLKKALQIAELSSTLRHIICLDKNSFKLLDKNGVEYQRYNGSNSEKVTSQGETVTEENLAYVIYTSGSTGTPKGVPISHKNLIPILRWSQDYFGFDSQTKVLQNLSHCFDFGLFELLTTLLFGGTLYYPNVDERYNPSIYADFISKYQINTIHTTPSLFCRAIAVESENLPSLKCLHLGGEPLTSPMVDEIFSAVRDDCVVYNGYGPTEASVNATIYKLESKLNRHRTDCSTVPIGKASANNYLYVLDRQGQPVPIGVPGELHIGGPGVCQGYLNRPELTVEKFIPNPFSQSDEFSVLSSQLKEALTSNPVNQPHNIQTEISQRHSTGSPEGLPKATSLQCVHSNEFAITQNSKRTGLRPAALTAQCANKTQNFLYKTGDLVRYLEDGNLEFLGRIDQQVKIHGFRIELGEIEAVLAKHPMVQDAVVIAQEDRPGDKRLIAYTVPSPGENSAFSSDDLRCYLKEKLPDHMVPAVFVRLNVLPLTSNGKVNRHALPTPEILHLGVEAAYVAPQTETERLIAAIWQEKLQIEKVGIYDNFFELGGHSLLLIQIYSKLRETFSQELLLVDLFKYSTINSLAKHLSQNKSKESSLKPSQGRADKRSLNQESIYHQSQVRQKHRLKRK